MTNHTFFFILLITNVMADDFIDLIVGGQQKEANNKSG